MNQENEERVRQIVVSLSALAINCASNEELKNNFYENPIEFLSKTGMGFPVEQKKRDKIKVYIDAKIYRWPKIIIKCKESKSSGYKYLLIDEGVQITGLEWTYLSEGRFIDLEKDLKIEYPQTVVFESIDEVIERIEYFYPGSLEGEDGEKIINSMKEWDRNEKEYGTYIIMPFIDADFFPNPPKKDC